MKIQESIVELYGLVREMKADLAKQTVLLERMDADRKEMETSIRKLELEDAKRKGIMTVVAAIGGAVGYLASWFVKHMTGGTGG